MTAVLALAVLAACRAERVEVDLTTDAIVLAAAGNAQRVPFSAVVGEVDTAIDADKRALIASIESVLKRGFPDATVTADIREDQYWLTVTGDLALAAGPPASGAPWYIAARANPADGSILVQLDITDTFGAFNADLDRLDAMIAADPYHPIRYRVSGTGGTIVAGGAEVDGALVQAAVIPVAGAQVMLGFAGGPWDATGGGFLYFPGGIAGN